MPSTPPDTGEVFEELVEHSGGPTALANTVGVSFHAVFKWRRDKRVPDAQKAILWVEALGIPVPPELRIIAGMSPSPDGGGEPARQLPVAQTPKLPTREAESEEPAGEVALVRRRFYAAPAVQRRRRHIQEKNVPTLPDIDWAA